jgi:hypothetical protein
MLRTARARRVVNLILGLFAAGFIAGGILALRHSSETSGERSRYANASACAAGAAAQVPPTCWIKVPAVVVGKMTDNHLGLPSLRLVVAVNGQQAGLEVLQTPGYDALQPGQRIELKFWGEAVTAIYSDAGLVPTPANPLYAGTLPQVGGASLVAVGVALLLLIPWRIPKRVQETRAALAA